MGAHRGPLLGLGGTVGVVGEKMFRAVASDTQTTPEVSVALYIQNSCSPVVINDRLILHDFYFSFALIVGKRS